MNLNTKSMRKNRLKHYALLTSLFLLWIGLSINFILRADLSPAVFSENIYVTQDQLANNRETIKKGLISGTFKSSNNYLGILSIRFETPSKANHDLVIFRLKESSAKNWLFQSTYNSDQFYFVNPYPFGFPIIPNSKNKQFDYELESINGLPIYSIAKNSDYPFLIAKYKIPKSILIGSRTVFFDFIYRKASYVVFNSYFLFASAIYLLPLFFYIIWELGLKNHLPKFNPNIFRLIAFLNYPFSLFIFVTIIIDSFFIQAFDDFSTLVLILLWTISLTKNRLSEKNTFVAAALFAILLPFLIYFGNEIAANKIATWIYYFLWTGLLQSGASIISETNPTKFAGKKI